MPNTRLPPSGNCDLSRFQPLIAEQALIELKIYWNGPYRFLCDKEWLTILHEGLRETSDLQFGTIYKFLVDYNLAREPAWGIAA
jgi:hypothetical protein